MMVNFAGKSRALLLSILSGLLLFAAPKVRADDDPNVRVDQPDDPNTPDPPSRVARLSYIDGNVSFQPTGTEDWAAAVKNRPVTVGDKIWSDQDSRVELQAGEASIHLGSMTALSFLNLDENVIQMRVAEGAINFRVREMREGDLYEVDTPNAAFTVKEAGAFRIDVNENGDGTRITVIRGEGEITAGGKTYDVHAGEQAELNGVEDPEFHVDRASSPDDLDRWASERDLKEEHSTSARYVSRDVPGYSDLDDYGDWREEPDYGPVWYPRTVEVGWAPYSYGYWNWVGPWGWTWVDYSPWGFAPFHYGRWAYVGGAWGWCPGPVYARPFYGPAFVGFYGGHGWGIGVGFGGAWGGAVGWFPLGWGEAYHPWYHASGHYFRNVNITNTRITNINNINIHNTNFNYAYAHNPRAVTAVSRNSFMNGQMVHGSAIRVNEAALRGAQVTNRLGLQPTRASFTGAAAARGHFSTPPASVMNRAVVARTAPAKAASHVPIRAVDTRTLSAARTGGNAGVNGRDTARVDRGANPAFGNRGAANSATPSYRPGREVNNGAAANSGATARQRELANNRPPSAGGASANRGSFGSSANVSPNRPANTPNHGGTRNWSAQGNSTDRGRAPQGFGSGASASARVDRPPNSGQGRAYGSQPQTGANRPYSNGSVGNRPIQSQPSRGNDRPPASYSGNGRSYQPQTRQNSAPNRGYDRPSSYSGGRSYEPPSRSYTAPSRSSDAPSRSYSAPSRSYSAPSRSYSAPSRSYSAPSHSYGGGGRSSGGSVSHGGGGGGGSRGGSSSHGGGGSSHSGGGRGH